MSKAKNAEQAHDMSGVPIYYADQPAGLALGPHVCRLTFGVEEDDGSEYPRPVVTVAIPTVSLLLMVNDLAHTLNDPAFKKSIASGLEAAVKKLAAGVTQLPSKSLRRPPAAKKAKSLPPH
jgi:hypothetical protein